MFWVVDDEVLRVMLRLGEESRYLTFAGSGGVSRKTNCVSQCILSPIYLGSRVRLRE